MLTQKYINHIAYKIIGSAIEVHKHLGPGLLESVYQVCFIEELTRNGLHVQSQVAVPIYYKDRELGNALKLDILVENIIIVEIKAVETMISLYKAQLLSYLKLTDRPKGLLINFNTEIIARDITSLVTESFSLLHKD